FDVVIPGDQVHGHAEGADHRADAAGFADFTQLRGRTERVATHVQGRQFRCLRHDSTLPANRKSSMILLAGGLTSGGFSSPARCATASSTTALTATGTASSDPQPAQRGVDRVLLHRSNGSPAR